MYWTDLPVRLINNVSLGTVVTWSEFQRIWIIYYKEVELVVVVWEN